MNHMCVGSVLLLASAALAAAVEFKRQTITIPCDQEWSLISDLVDVDGDGLTDLLVLLPEKNELRIYRQRKSGFAATPDQTITLPDQTVWVAVRDVDPQEGRELVVSTAAGIGYFRHNGGVFELSPQTLIEVRQALVADRLRVALDAPGKQDVNDVIPVIFEDHVILYEKDSNYAWRPQRTVDLTPRETTWEVREERSMRGPAPGYTMELRTTLRARPQDSRTQELNDERKAAQKLVARIVKSAQWRTHEVQYQDVNGDKQEDIVLWNNHGEFNPGATILLLLRGPDGRLPEQPTHVLRHTGIPIRVNRELGISPFWDLDGDGRCELILVALKTRVTSWSGLVDIALSRGVDWVFTVRSGRNGDYSGNPDFRMDVASMAPHDEQASYLFLIDGDFNGDGRKDMLIKRGFEQFDVYLSAAGADYFQAGPALSLAAPAVARKVETTDLNGDGISDLFVQKALEAQITICLSQSNSRKGTSK